LNPVRRLEAEEALHHNYFADLPKEIYKLPHGEFSILPSLNVALHQGTHQLQIPSPVSFISDRITLVKGYTVPNKNFSPAYHIKRPLDQTKRLLEEIKRSLDGIERPLDETERAL